MAKSLPKSIEHRKQILASLITSGKIHSQADVVKELKAKGMVVTQATASRDLQELGAMKSKDKDGATQYILGGVPSGASGGHLIVSIAYSANTVVLRTPPAAAQFLASSLDSAILAGELPSAIGTIAGDDTVLVIASTASGGGTLAKKITTIFGKGK